MSRRTATEAAATSNTTAVAAGKSRTRGFGFANGRISPAQPSGVAHRNHRTSLETEAAVRRATAMTSTPVETPVASRFVGAELACQRTDAGKHRQDRHGCEREIGGAAYGELAGDE